MAGQGEQGGAINLERGADAYVSYKSQERERKRLGVRNEKAERYYLNETWNERENFTAGLSRKRQLKKFI